MAIHLNVRLVPPPPPWESQVERRNHRWAAQRDRVCDANRSRSPVVKRLTVAIVCGLHGLRVRVSQQLCTYTVPTHDSD